MWHTYLDCSWPPNGRSTSKKCQWLIGLLCLELSSTRKFGTRESPPKVTSIYIWTWAETLNRNECMTYSPSKVLSWTPVSIYPYCASFLKKELPIRSIYQCCIKKLFILSWTLTVLITWAFLQPIKVLNFLETQMLSLETQMLSLETQMLSLKTHMLSLETQML